MAAKHEPGIERRFVETGLGRIHAALSGTGRRVLLLHQTPRSWDEYRDVLPLLGREFGAIAMDTPGFGDSDPLPPGAASIELWAKAGLLLLDALEARQAAVVGHHTGAAIAIEMAASAPERIEALVLSACPFVNAERRLHYHSRPVIDDVGHRPDGTHLIRLWNGRRPLYPKDATDLLDRFMIDALRAGVMAAEGHRIVNRYRMETRLPAVRCPTLLLAAEADPHAEPAASRLATAIAGSRLTAVKEATVAFPDQMPELFATLVRDYLAQHVPAARAER